MPRRRRSASRSTHRYDLDIPEIAEVWRRGSVVASWLLDLTAAALAEDPKLARRSGRVSDSGEGRWTVLAAVDEGVPVHVLSASLFDRFESRQEAGVREPDPVGDAQAVRGARGEEGLAQPSSLGGDRRRRSIRAYTSSSGRRSSCSA